MTNDLMSRLTVLSGSAATPHSEAAASILRKLATKDDACEKLVVMAGHLRKLSPEAQSLVVDAVEKVIFTV